MTGKAWAETVAGRCRYGSEAADAFPGTVLFERAEDDYQGYAWVLVALEDGRFALYDWTYGSCSGCDEWESDNLSGEQIIDTMRAAAVYFPTWADVRKACGLDGGTLGDFSFPSANVPTNGSIPGMLHMAFGGVGETFREMAEFVAEQPYTSETAAVFDGGAV